MPLDKTRDLSKNPHISRPPLRVRRRAPYNCVAFATKWQGLASRRIAKSKFHPPNLAHVDGGIRNHKPRLLRPIDRNPVQQSGVLKLAQRVANGGPGNRAPCFASFVVEDFSSDVPIRAPEQQPCDGDPLLGRTQPMGQQVLSVSEQRSIPTWPTYGDIRAHQLDNPGIGTPNICRIRKMLSSNTTAVPTRRRHGSAGYWQTDP